MSFHPHSRPCEGCSATHQELGGPCILGSQIFGSWASLIDMHRILHFTLIQSEFQKIMLLSDLSTLASLPNTGEKIVATLPTHVLARLHHLACCRIHDIRKKCSVIHWKWTQRNGPPQTVWINGYWWDIDPLPMQTLFVHMTMAHSRTSASPESRHRIFPLQPSQTCWSKHLEMGEIRFVSATPYCASLMPCSQYDSYSRRCYQMVHILTL